MKQTVKTKGALLRALACVWAVLALALAGVTPAFADGAAAGATSANIVVKGVEGATAAKAYKVIDINWDAASASPVDPMYTWDANVAAWLKGNSAFADYVGDGGKVADEYEKITDTNKKALSEALQLAILNGTIAGLTPAEVTVPAGADTLTFENLGMGGYLIAVVGTARVYQPIMQNVAPSYDSASGAWKFSGAELEAAAKSTPVSFEKKIVDAEGSLVDSAIGSIGSDVAFRLTATAPVYPSNAVDKKFTIGDELSAGLTYKVGTLVVKAGNAALAEGTDYTLAVEGQKLKIDVVNYDAIAGATVTVDYKATINKDAVVGEAGNPNSATLTYSNDPFDRNSYKDIPDEVKVFTFGIEIFKLDKADQTTLLAGAVFKVQSKADGSELSFVRTGDGQYRLATDADDAAAKVVELSVGEAGDMLGKLDIRGLDAGDYQLVEVKAPAEYTRINGPVDVKLEAIKDGEDYTGHLSEESTTRIGYKHLDVLNGKGWSLPSTGDAGLFALVAAGILLVGGGIMVVRGRRAE